MIDFNGTFFLTIRSSYSEPKASLLRSTFAAFELCSERVKPADESIKDYPSQRYFAVNTITQTYVFALVNRERNHIIDITGFFFFDSVAWLVIVYFVQ